MQLIGAGVALFVVAVVLAMFEAPADVVHLVFVLAIVCAVVGVVLTILASTRGRGPGEPPL